MIGMTDRKETKMANGRVVTGYSKPWVAVYSNEGTTVTYASGQPLARGVGVKINPDNGSENRFYADNVEAENAGTTFGTGTVNITVDGLKEAARSLVYGLPEADQSGWVHYGNSQSVPFIGFGCVVRYMEDNVTTYEPLILPKIQLTPEGLEAETQEEEIDWQTTELTANIYRDDTANQDWRLDGTAVATEAAAEEAIKTKFNVKTSG